LQLDSTEDEDEIKNRLKSHTFHTSLFSAVRPNREQTVPVGFKPNGPPQVNYAVRFNPDVLDKMDGGMYGFRDEVSLPISSHNSPVISLTLILSHSLGSSERPRFSAELDQNHLGIGLPA